MTANEDRIEQLVQTVPTIERTKGQKFWRALSIACNVIAVVTLGLYIIGSVQTAHLANCTNNVLGTRAPITASDNAALRQLAESVQTLGITDRGFARSLNDVLGSPKSEQPAKYKAFLAVLKRHVDDTGQASSVAGQALATLIQDQKTRTANPIGKC